jgi:uncharacterized protein
MELIGRQDEKIQLLNKLNSKKAELIAVLGRRRIGKTFLIKNVYEKNLLFQITGLYKSNVKEHMLDFTKQISAAYKNKYEIETPTNWFEAFDMLEELIDYQPKNKKQVIFLDEMPWMATNKSRFITAFTRFWNNYAVNKPNLIVVICGSASGWMINKIIKDRGGLHNRITDKLSLKPFTLKETAQFLKSKKIVCTPTDLVKLYMAIGGIPYYLEHINKGESITQAINRLCFTPLGTLQKEYKELFKSLFNKSERHEKIIQQLSNNPEGLNRIQLQKKAKFKSGGNLTDILNELIYADFVSAHIPYGKNNNDRLYKIKDMYVLFYNKYISNYLSQQTDVWTKLATKPTWHSWSGLAFENICMIHIPQIIKALKLDGILCTVHKWRHIGNKEMNGAQIDLLIDRADNIINICEIKFTEDAFVINQKVANQLKNKISSFKYFTQTKKAIHLVFISKEPVYNNIHKQSIVQNEIVLNALFT